MPSCLVRYRVVIVPRGLRGADLALGVAGTALVDEEWEPDEWGSPGRCVRRRARSSYPGTMVGCYLDCVRRRSGFWRIRRKIHRPKLMTQSQWGKDRYKTLEH